MTTIIYPSPEPLDPLLVSLNSHMNNMGLRRGDQLIFYAPTLGYKVWIYHSKYFVTRISRMVPPFGPEPIPLVEGGGMSQVTDVLNTQPFFLTEDQVKIQWADQNTYNPEIYDTDPFAS